jgi:uncharacterized protein (TIGR02246 family)
MSTLTKGRLEAWLTRYGEAWARRDADEVTQLFTDDAIYHEMPFDEPLRGRGAIHGYWLAATADQRDVRFQAQTIATIAETAVAHWSANYRLSSTGTTVELDGMFVLEFDPDSGLCSALREWWHARGDVLP